MICHLRTPPRFKTSAIACVLISASVSLLADIWPQFRGPTGQGLASATNVPLHWNVTSNVAWKVALPGSGWSSPILVNGRLYLTAGVGGVEGSPVSLRAFCVNVADGSILWNTEVLPLDPSATGAKHKKNSLASATPILDGQRLFVHFGHLGTAALDLSGRVLWRQTGLKYSPVHGNGGSPAVIDDLLVFSCDGGEDPFVVALDVSKGEVRWRVPRATQAKKTFSFSTPLAINVGGARQIISPGSGYVGAYDPRDGRELWRVRYGEGYSVVPRPVFAHGLLFITSGFDRPSLFAIKPDGAKGDVTDTHVVWRSDRSIPHTPSLLVVGDELYFVSDNGIATSADARTGKVHWTERLGGDFSASPIYAEGRVYFLNEAGVTSVVQHGKTYELLAKNDLGERALASFVVANSALFIRTESHLWKIGKR